MIEALQAIGFFAVHCRENDKGWECSLVFINDKCSQNSPLEIINPLVHPEERIYYPIKPIEPGFYTDYQLEKI